MLANRDVPNTELTNEHKIKLGPAGRDKLNKAGLLRTWKENNRLVHRITDEGTTWCEKDLAEGESAPSGPLARAYAKYLRILVQYHLQHGTLIKALHSGDLESLIRTAYLDLSVKPQDWVRLAKLRPRLNGADKPEVDSVLLKMVKTGTVHLAPDSNRKVLTDADHAAAVRIGSEDKHLMAIEES
jgi:hypothetical protein